MTPTYHSTEQKIDFLLKKFRDGSFDDYTQSHIANYVCVLLSGLIENAIRDIISAHVETKSTPRIANYVKSHLDRFRNPDPESVTRLLLSFDAALVDRLEGHWSGEIKDAVGSIVGNRHLIAHGRSTTLTLARVGEWFKSAKNLIAFLEAEFA